MYEGWRRGDGGRGGGGRNEGEDGSAALRRKKNWEERLFFLLLPREVIMMLQLIRACQFLMQVPLDCNILFGQHVVSRRDTMGDISWD